MVEPGLEHRDHRRAIQLHCCFLWEQLAKQLFCVRIPTSAVGDQRLADVVLLPAVTDLQTKSSRTVVGFEMPRAPTTCAVQLLQSLLVSSPSLEQQLQQQLPVEVSAAYALPPASRALIANM